MERKYLNTEDSLFDKETVITENMKNFFYYFKCETCGRVSSKCIYKKKGKLIYDFNCTQCNRKKTNIEKFGCENPFSNEKIKNKIRDVTLQKYGVENVNKLQSVRDKITETKKKRYGENFEGIVERQKSAFIERYGVDNPQKNEEVRNKTKATNIKKYGAPCSLENLEVIRKCQSTMVERYGVSKPGYMLKTRTALITGKKQYDLNIALGRCNQSEVTLLEDYRGIYDENGTIRYKMRCNKCGDIFYHNLSAAPICRHCNPSSVEQMDVLKYLKSIYNGTIEYNNRKALNGKEIDLYLPEVHVGIEYDGSYWHNNLHLNRQKYKLAEAAGIRMMFIHDYEWLDENTNRKIKSILASMLNGAGNRIQARKCDIVELDTATYRKFMTENHLQGFCVASVRYGLMYKGELVQVMSFNKPRFSKDAEWELIRECSKSGTFVIGGKERLLKHFERCYKPVKLVSFCDARFFTGESYKRCGFKLVGLTPENYVYVSKRYDVIPRYKAQKKKLPSLLGDKFDMTKSEKANMLDNGFSIIYDAGNLKFVKTYKNIKD